MTRAAMSLPTPLSPVRRTFASDRAAHSTSVRILAMTGLTPMRSSSVSSTPPPYREYERTIYCRESSEGPDLWDQRLRIELLLSVVGWFDQNGARERFFTMMQRGP